MAAVLSSPMMPFRPWEPHSHPWKPYIYAHCRQGDAENGTLGSELDVSIGAHNVNTEKSWGRKRHEQEPLQCKPHALEDGFLVDARPQKRHAREHAHDEEGPQTPALGTLHRTRGEQENHEGCEQVLMKNTEEACELQLGTTPLSLHPQDVASLMISTASSMLTARLGGTGGIPTPKPKVALRPYNKKNTKRKPFTLCVPCFTATSKWVIKAIMLPNGHTKQLSGHTKSKQCPHYPEPSPDSVRVYAAAFRRESRGIVLSTVAAEAFKKNSDLTDQQIVAHLSTCTHDSSP